jgi:hypothetical protein
LYAARPLGIALWRSARFFISWAICTNLCIP